jgi:hypothetical protein
MKRNACVLLFATGLASLLRADSHHILHASFSDGTGVEIFTETTGSSPIDFEGEMGIGPGAGSQDLVNRVVRDREDHILFAYNLEASRGAVPNTVMIRIEPISAATEAGMLKYEASRGRPASAHLPTVAEVREFPAVKAGEAISLDILYNPATREKVFDVLRPIAASSSHMQVTVVPAPEMISLKDIAIRVNGRTINSPALWMIGSVIRIDIPHLGTWVMAPSDPHEASSGHPFTPIAHADGKTLTWQTGGSRVEVTSETNILTLSGKGVLWVNHDSHYQPDIVGLQSADSVEWLFPRR